MAKRQAAAARTAEGKRLAEPAPVRADRRDLPFRLRRLPAASLLLLRPVARGRLQRLPRLVVLLLQLLDLVLERLDLRLIGLIDVLRLAQLLLLAVQRLLRL